MSRQVCGNCLCPYGDDGQCACVEDQAMTKEAGMIYLPNRWSGDTHNDKDTGCVDVEATEQLIAKQAAEIERLKSTPPAQREDLHCVIADLTRQCQESDALLRQASELLHRQWSCSAVWSMEEAQDLDAAIKQHLGEV